MGITGKNSSSGRSWQLPQTPWVLRMTWSELLFAHWPVKPEVLAPLIPQPLTLDTREGKAWIGIVPFLMSDVAPRCLPAVPKLSRFLELNVRTYVSYEGRPGVWFFSLDAENPIAVRAARATFNLPYMDARMSLTKDRTSRIDYQSVRTHRGEPQATIDITYCSSGSPFQGYSGSLEHWLTARYCLYSVNRKGRLYRGEIDHEPWTFSLANWWMRDNTMCDPLQVRLKGEPHLLIAEPIHVRAWPAMRCN